MRLENYACFEEGVQGLAGEVHVLSYFRQEAVEKKEAALLVYIQQQLEYAKMWKLLEFSQVHQSWRCFTAAWSLLTSGAGACRPATGGWLAFLALLHC